MAITLHNVCKSYTYYDHATDRLWEALTGKKRCREYTALHPMTLTINRSEVVGVVGRNGAGKSTFLKLVAGMILPSAGEIEVDGRISALLELGTGFHPEMSGRDNVYLSAAVMGLSTGWVDAHYPEIVAFSGLADFIDQPIKTYSSGMRMRLAFAVATTVEPDILILDEILSVGDGAFARKSFERIMDFKKADKTILFCSHSMYQVEAICDRAIWIDQGELVMDGDPAQVVMAYNQFLDQAYAENKSRIADNSPVAASGHGKGLHKVGRISGVDVRSGNMPSGQRPVTLQSGMTDLSITVRFQSNRDVPAPSVALSIIGSNGRALTSASSCNDGVEIARDDTGAGEISITFPKFSLLKGVYWLNIFLFCEQGIHLYDRAERVAELEVVQTSLEQGVVSLPRQWKDKYREAEPRGAYG